MFSHLPDFATGVPTFRVHTATSIGLKRSSTASKVPAEEVHHQLPFPIAGRGAEDVALAFEEVRLGRAPGFSHTGGQPPGHVGVPPLCQ